MNWSLKKWMLQNLTQAYGRRVMSPVAILLRSPWIPSGLLGIRQFLKIM